MKGQSAMDDESGTSRTTGKRRRWLLAIDPVFEGTVEATEEAIVNALVAARTMTGIDGIRYFAIPHDELVRLLKQYGRHAP